MDFKTQSENFNQSISYNTKPESKLEQPKKSNSFTEFVTRLVTGQSFEKSAQLNGSLEVERQIDNKSINQATQAPQAIQTTSRPVKSACRAPLSRRFAHPCTCFQHNSHHKPSNNWLTNHNLSTSANINSLHLYDPVSKRCLPVSKSRDMLLKDCHNHAVNSLSSTKHHHTTSCLHDDLICDPRRFRCVCKPPLHLYYESDQLAFACVRIGLTASPDGRTTCRQGQIYNVISKECQKIFDVNELPPNVPGVSATQFSFVTIVLLWILLLILIVTAKLRKLRTSNLYRNSPNSERRMNHSSSFRHHGQNNWFQPFISAVNGHQHLSQQRTNGHPNDEFGNHDDTDFFLNHINERINDHEGNLVGSQQSLNNPPPKFEEIYPACPEEPEETIRPPLDEDLPSYDEAMKLQNTMPPDSKE